MYDVKSMIVTCTMLDNWEKLLDHGDLGPGMNDLYMMLGECTCTCTKLYDNIVKNNFH